ncbi:MAG TPA: serine protease [Verrucomicrobiae bacterium]|nr:serine protease [Verrucomicrobiae bacterium]
MMRLAAAALALALALCACSGNADDAFVADARQLHRSVVLLSMRIPPENKKDGYDDGYATGIVVASGNWGSDVLTVQHAIDQAWDLHVTYDNAHKAPAATIAANADLDVALVRTPLANLPVAHLGSSAHLGDQIGRSVGLLGYPIPDEFEDEELGPGTSLNAGRLSSIRKDALEVTLPIVPGESGGPVFLVDTGEIVGLADSRFDDERSIGFAIPIDDAKNFLHRVDALHGF